MSTVETKLASTIPAKSPKAIKAHKSELDRILEAMRRCQENEDLSDLLALINNNN